MPVLRHLMFKFFFSFCHNFNRIELNRNDGTLSEIQIDLCGRHGNESIAMILGYNFAHGNRP